MQRQAAWLTASYCSEQMNYTYKEIGLIAFPVMMSILVEQLINITDALFLGHVGAVELGASALAGIWFLAIYMLGFGFSLGLQVVIARRNGEQRYAETGKTFFQGLLFLSLLAVSLCLLSRLCWSALVLSVSCLAFFFGRHHTNQSLEHCGSYGCIGKYPAEWALHFRPRLEYIGGCHCLVSGGVVLFGSIDYVPTQAC